MSADLAEDPTGALGALPWPQRQLIMRIKLFGPATAADLAAALYVTPTAARHSLRGLAARGLVESRPGRADFAGRPPSTYSLTDEAERLFPSAIPEFLDELTADPSSELRAAILAAVERTVARRFRRAVRQEGGSCPLDAMEELGYVPTADPIRDGVRVEIGNCPWRQLPSRLPEICDVERRALSRISGLELVLKSHRVQGDPTCVWHCRQPRSDGG